MDFMLLVALCAGVLTFGAVGFIGRRYRCRALSEHIESIVKEATFVRDCPLANVTHVEASLTTKTDKRIESAESRARAMRIPTYITDKPDEGRENTLKRISTLASHPAFVIATAGIDGINGSLLDIAKIPGLANDFAETMDLIQAELEQAGVEVVDHLSVIASEGGQATLNTISAFLDHYQDHPWEAVTVAFSVFRAVEGSPFAFVKLLLHFSKPEHIAIFKESLGSFTIDAAQHAHQIAEALSVHGDHLASGMEQFSHGAAVASESLTVDFHFPVVTACFSVVREIGILSQGKTTLGTSVKNALLDVSGTGAGGFVGAKLGTVVGTAILPGIGTFIGLIGGGIIGALGGRTVTNSIKQKPMKDAHESWESAIFTMERQTGKAIIQAESSIQKATLAAENRFHSEFRSPKRLSDDQDLRTKATRLLKIAKEDLYRVHNRVDTAVANAYRHIPKDEWYHRWAGLSVKGLAKHRITEAKALAYKSIETARTALPPDQLVHADPLNSLVHLASSPASTTGQLSVHRVTIPTFIKQQRCALTLNLVAWGRAMSANYRASVADVASAINNELKTFQEVCKVQKLKVKQAEDKLREEMGKLGLA
jgi:hypothetical protein